MVGLYVKMIIMPFSKQTDPNLSLGLIKCYIMVTRLLCQYIQQVIGIISVLKCSKGL